MIGRRSAPDPIAGAPPRPRIAYFVHNLADPAVSRRVRMLQLGGADVIAFGFRRKDSAPVTLDAPSVELGTTEDFKLGARALKVALNLARIPKWRAALGDCEVVMARSLELLALASAARRLVAPRARLVYECLDIHGAMIGSSPRARGLRALERRLLSRASLLIVSSPGFLREYFAPVQRIETAALIVENKVLASPGEEDLAVRAYPPGPPWRIGWFGMIRCRRSLELLSHLARRRPDLVEVVIRGRPTRPALPDFDQVVASTPGLRYEGPYSPDQLRRLYADVHFCWAVDCFEEGANSQWLLPNRIYEGGSQGAVPIGLGSVETGRWLRQRGLGLILDTLEALEAGLAGVDRDAFVRLSSALLNAQKSLFTAGPDEAQSLVRSLLGR